jgi:HAD superfamily hydrolase (TIGR01662 family)
MKDYKLYIFDADGTLRRCTVEGQPCPNKPGEWELIPGVRERLRSLWANNMSANGAIASNQGGIAFGFLTWNIANTMLHDLADELHKETDLPLQILMCPHHPRGNKKRWVIDCACRKPRPGMLYQAMMMYEIGPADTLYVGDMDTDRQAAENAGVDFMWAKDFFGWEEG